MDWMTIAQLIINVGIPATQKLVALWESKAQVTAAALNDLIALESQTARDRMLLTLKAQGIDPASPQGLALLAAVS
jgi:hypothetical protein